MSSSGKGGRKSLVNQPNTSRKSSFVSPRKQRDVKAANMQAAEEPSSNQQTPKEEVEDKDKDKDKDKADEEAKNELAKAIIERLSDPALKEVQNAVEDSFTESTSYMKNAHAMRHQEVRLRPQPLDNLANNTYTSL